MNEVVLIGRLVRDPEIRYTNTQMAVCTFTLAVDRPFSRNRQDGSPTADFIRISALCMPIFAFLHTTYFTLRSGGKTVITFLFDSVYLWVISIPVAFFLSRFTDMPIVPLYLTCNMVDLIKCTVGFILLKKGVWINNIVGEE